jgi:hypothetical protein
MVRGVGFGAHSLQFAKGPGHNSAAPIDIVDRSF